jgi:hypothetical protein
MPRVKGVLADILKNEIEKLTSKADALIDLVTAMSPKTQVEAEPKLVAWPDVNCGASKHEPDAVCTFKHALVRNADDAKCAGVGAFAAVRVSDLGGSQRRLDLQDDGCVAAQVGGHSTGLCLRC